MPPGSDRRCGSAPRYAAAALSNDTIFRNYRLRLYADRGRAGHFIDNFYRHFSTSHAKIRTPPTTAVDATLASFSPYDDVPFCRQSVEDFPLKSDAAVTLLLSMSQRQLSTFDAQDIARVDLTPRILFSADNAAAGYHFRCCQRLSADAITAPMPQAYRCHYTVTLITACIISSFCLARRAVDYYATPAVMRAAIQNAERVEASSTRAIFATT